MLWCTINLFIWCGAASSTPRPHRDVVTSQGVVRGYLAADPPHFAYLGVPYARPTRHHRFKAPRAPRAWDGIFEATHRVRCPQPGSGTEECLVVNVFSPEHASEQPVLVIVHDGWHQGWGAFHPPTRLLEQGFVIVTFNYRLGALGFLCLGHPDAPGNAGLKDQVFALYWVQRNVANFGGNPRDVTAYGAGTGAASVELLLLSGSIDGLAHRAILESGSILSPLSLTYDPLLTAIDAAVGLGYQGTEDRDDLLKFYNKLAAKKIVNATMFLPCLERHSHNSYSLIETDPTEIYQQGAYQKVPMLIAYTDPVGVGYVEEIKEFKLSPDSFKYLLPNNLGFNDDIVKDKVLDLIRGFYLGQDVTEENMLQYYLDYLNDLTLEYPIIKSALLYTTNSPLPVYLMKLQSNGQNLNACNQRILDYFYGNECENIAEPLVSLWSNFIKYGDPTPLTTSIVPLVWLPLNDESGSNQMDIRKIKGLLFKGKLKMTDSFANDFIIFWNQIYKKFYRFHRGFNISVNV